MDGGREQRDHSADEAAIRALEAGYDAAWGAGDLDALLACFAGGATVVDPFGGVSSGRPRIRELLGELLSGSGRGSTHEATIVGVHFVTDDVALADGEALIEGLTAADGNLRPPITHRFTDVMVRGRGGWRIPDTGLRVHGRTATLIPSSALDGPPTWRFPSPRKLLDKRVPRVDTDSVRSFQRRRTR